VEGTRHGVGCCSTACGWERKGKGRSGPLQMWPTSPLPLPLSLSFWKFIYASSPTRVPLFHVTFKPFSHLIPIIFYFFTPLYPFTPLNNQLSFSLYGCFWYYEIPLSLSSHVALSVVCKMQIVLRIHNSKIK